MNDQNKLPKDKKPIYIILVAVLLIAVSISIYEFKKLSVTNSNNNNTTTDVSKTFNNLDFSLTVPSDWEMGTNRYYSSENNSYYIVYGVANIDKLNASQKHFLQANDLIGYEQSQVASLCQETDSCGTISQTTNLDLPGADGIEFIITYPGLSLDEKRGSIKEIHQTFLKNGKLYKFWASEKNPPPELSNQYPTLSPTPTALFKEIMQTLVLK
jgi:hypothetical protein